MMMMMIRDLSSKERKKIEEPRELLELEPTSQLVE